MKISEIIHNELPRTCQIQQEAEIPVQSIKRQNSASRVAQIQRKSKKPQVSTRPIPDLIKHKLIQDRLTKLLMRQSNIVKPTTDDIQIAKDRVANELKRSDLEYQKKLEHALRSEVGR
jgi:CCR4-NOT transcriptional regulation complex NOT5 subunit